MSADKIREYLSHDRGLDLLKTIDNLNPMSIPVNKMKTIKDISVAMNMPLRETWQLIDKAYDADLVMFCGGVLSRKKVDLTELGEMFCECTTANDIKEVLRNVKD